MPLVSPAELVKKITQSQVVSFPTDTVPALAVLPDRSELIFQIKKRPQHKPLILMAASLEELWPYVKGSTEEMQIWQKIANTYLPGPLTLVLPSSPKVSPQLNPTDPNTIGIRVPNHPLAQQILSQTGALATTSANLSGQPPLTNMQAIASSFPEVFVLDYPETNIMPTPSTVIKWTGNDWKILRQGPIYLSTKH